MCSGHIQVRNAHPQVCTHVDYSRLRGQGSRRRKQEEESTEKPAPSVLSTALAMSTLPVSRPIVQETRKGVAVIL